MNKSAIVAPLCAFALVGCASYPKTEIATVSTSLTAVQTAFDAYYQALNRYGQESYVYQQVYRGQPISLDTVDRKGATYSKDALAARLAAIKVVGTYAEVLGKYAGGTDSQDLAASASSLSTSVFTLRDAVDKDAASSSAYVGPVGDLLKAVVGWGTDAKLQSDFKTYAGRATPQVLQILTLLKADATMVLQPQQLIGASGRRAALVGAYNAAAANLSLDQKAETVAAIDASIAAEAAAESLDLVATLASAEKAITGLQKKVEGGQIDDAQIVQDIADFASRVTALKKITDQIAKPGAS